MMDFDSLPDDAVQPGSIAPVSVDPSSTAPTIQAPSQPSFDDLVSDDDKYGTIGQQAITGLEGAAKGVLGPIAPLVETSLLGIPGKDILAREHANPVTHGVAEAGTFLGSLFTGAGEATLAGKIDAIGKAAEALTGLGKATGIAKIAATGIKAGAELSALSASSELSKLIEGDKGQTLGSAAITIGLAGIMGGVGGAALGSVSPLWNKTKNILGVDKLATDFIGETKAIQEAGDPIMSATNELKGRIVESQDMWKIMSETKPEVLAKAMPARTPEALAKVDAQLQTVSDTVADAIKQADKSIKTKSAVPYIAEDFEAWKQAVQASDATFADQYAATNKLKTSLESYAKWSATEEGSAKGALGRSISNVIRPLLEDTKVWGAAGDVQRVTNEAITGMIRATNDIKGPLLSKTLGELEVAPEKVQTLINQTNAGKLGRKANVIGNYLEATDKYADAINKVHLENGLDAPLASKLNPTPVLNHALNTELTPGVSLARWANRKGAATLGNAVGEAASGGIGATLGSLVGHPLLGAWAGEKVLAPIFSSLAKPLAENAVNSMAAKGAVDYLGNAIKGQGTLSNSISNLFIKGAEVIGKDLIPDQESRDKLEKSLTYFEGPGNAQNVAGSLGHYLPSHATAAAQTAAMASNYLAALKPKEPQLSPLDVPSPPSKSAQAKYDRALDIAQQPLMALKHVKDGTLLPQDVQTLRMIYPSLHDAMIKQITNQLIEKKDLHLPYAQRVSLNTLIGGAPLDSTMTPSSAQAIIHSSTMQQIQQQTDKSGAPKKASGSELRQINKVDALYDTKSESREAHRRK